ARARIQPSRRHRRPRLGDSSGSDRRAGEAPPPRRPDHLEHRRGCGPALDGCGDPLHCAPRRRTTGARPVPRRAALTGRRPTPAAAAARRRGCGGAPRLLVVPGCDARCPRVADRRPGPRRGDSPGRRVHRRRGLPLGALRRHHPRRGRGLGASGGVGTRWRARGCRAEDRVHHPRAPQRRAPPPRRPVLLPERPEPPLPLRRRAGACAPAGRRRGGGPSCVGHAGGLLPWSARGRGRGRRLHRARAVPARGAAGPAPGGARLLRWPLSHRRCVHRRSPRCARGPGGRRRAHRSRRARLEHRGAAGRGQLARAARRGPGHQAASAAGDRRLDGRRRHARHPRRLPGRPRHGLPGTSRRLRPRETASNDAPRRRVGTRRL
ncbi:MAG: hypothetical protein AVDCRST_MAG50-2071, partial [uncultured Acidimicrobiales bacterium]